MTTFITGFSSSIHHPWHHMPNFMSYGFGSSVFQAWALRASTGVSSSLHLGRITSTIWHSLAWTSLNACGESDYSLWFIGLIAYFLIPKVIGIVYTYLTWVLSTFKITIPDPDPNMVNLDQYGQPWGVAAVIKIGT